MSEYGFPLTHIFPYKNRIVDSNVMQYYAADAAEK